MKLKMLTHPTLNWSENQTPKSTEFDDYYYSTDGALEEIDYIFIQHNQLISRLKTAQNFCIAETGFGTGLNFLRTVQLWFKTNLHSDSHLHFISFEKFPLTQDALKKAHQPFPELAEISQLLIDNYPFRLPGWHTVALFNGRLTLTLWFGDVLQGLPEADIHVDAWFLDGFAPSRNPEMWQPDLYTQMARTSDTNTTFATFTAAGHVRRGLEKSGFRVEKDVGFKNKREMCFGQLIQKRPSSLKAPWFSKPKTLYTNQTAIIIGAGLAGATTAFQLAKAGWKVTVIEQEEAASKAASGNLAGAIHPLVTADWNLRSQWYLKGFETTLKWLKPWLEKHKITGNLNGLVHLAATPTTHQRIQDALDRVGLPDTFAQWKTPQEIESLTDNPVKFPGLYFPLGGWVQPSSIVKHCLSHPNIETVFSKKVTQIQSSGDNWQVACCDSLMAQALQTFTAEVCVVATAGLDTPLNQALDLPIRPVKGQVTYLPSEAINKPLKIAMTHQGYSVSLDPQTHITGATFEAPDLSETLSLESHQANIEIANKAIANWINPETLLDKKQGKVGFRPTSPDHLPIIGPVADASHMQQAYLTTSHTQAVYRYPKQKYQPGLYVNNGHGARGLMSVFLAAEMIGDLIHQTPLALPNAIYHASHPARFQIRRWRKGLK